MAALAVATRTGAVLAGVDDDDCATVEWDADLLVVTTDFINPSPAVVELGQGGWRDLGRLVACHNFADLAGSGCWPRYYLSGICAPMGTTDEDLLDFTAGVCEICHRYGCALVGGDTKFGRARAVCGTALGQPMGTQGPFLRGNAEPGFKIVVSGPLGGFAAAVACLGSSDGFSDLERSQAVGILARTDVPLEMAEIAARSECRCAGTDISDGLGTDVADICRSSSLTARVDEDRIPVHWFAHLVAARLQVPPWSFAFASGGDFACAFGVPSAVADVCVASGASSVGSFHQGPPAILSKVAARPLPLGGHCATRTCTFAEEIVASVNGMREFYRGSS